MSRLKISLLVAVLACVATSTGLYFGGRARMREAASLREANDRLRFEAGHRRNSAARPAPAPVATGPVPNVIRPTDNPPARTTTTIVADYRNEGTATPQAALQTLAWTGDRGDPEELGRLIVFDAAARGRAQAYFDTLPPEVRGEVGTIDRLAAVELTASIVHRPFPRATALEQATLETVDENRVVLHLPGSIRDRMEFARTGEGWKYVITAAMVEAFLANHAALAPR